MGGARKTLAAAAVRWEPRAKVYALDQVLNWCQASIASVDESARQAVIHFDGWNRKFDIQVSFDTRRVAPLSAPLEDLVVQPCLQCHQHGLPKSLFICNVCEDTFHVDCLRKVGVEPIVTKHNTWCCRTEKCQRSSTPASKASTPAVSSTKTKKAASRVDHGSPGRRSSKHQDTEPATPKPLSAVLPSAKRKEPRTKPGASPQSATKPSSVKRKRSGDSDRASKRIANQSATQRSRSAKPASAEEKLPSVVDAELMGRTRRLAKALNQAKFKTINKIVHTDPSLQNARDQVAARVEDQSGRDHDTNQVIAGATAAAIAAADDDDANLPAALQSHSDQATSAATTQRRRPKKLPNNSLSLDVEAPALVGLPLMRSQTGKGVVRGTIVDVAQKLDHVSVVFENGDKCSMSRVAAIAAVNKAISFRRRNRHRDSEGSSAATAGDDASAVAVSDTGSPPRPLRSRSAKKVATQGRNSRQQPQQTAPGEDNTFESASGRQPQSSVVRRPVVAGSTCVQESEVASRRNPKALGSASACVHAASPSSDEIRELRKENEALRKENLDLRARQQAAEELLSLLQSALVKRKPPSSASSAQPRK